MNIIMNAKKLDIKREKAIFEEIKSKIRRTN
jgi:hypothetical protein